jgi:hypothetical protein
MLLVDDGVRAVLDAFPGTVVKAIRQLDKTADRTGGGNE